MKIAKVIAESWCYDDMEKECLEALIAEKLEPVRELLEKIAHYNHSDYCDGWYDNALVRINPDTGSVYRFNSCPVYECDCSRNAGGMNQWELADRALTLLFNDE